MQRQLVADVPVGAHLSGGMDSGSITAVAAQQLPYLNTFTVGFDMTSAGGMELPTDEREKAEAMSYQFKTEHYEAVLKSGDMERCMPALMWHLEDPRVGQSYPNYYVARLASKFVKVVLAGSGGDELFAGYPWRYYRAVVNDDFDDYIEKYYGFWHRLIPNASLPSFFRPDVWADVKDLRTIDVFRAQFRDMQRRPSRLPSTSTTRCTSRRARSCTACFLVEDKLSMAHSLENRVPFMDNDLVEFAQQVPVSPQAARPRLRRAPERERARQQVPALLPAHARRQAPAAQGDGALRARDDHRSRSSRASPGPTRAGSAATRSTTSAASCSTRARRSTSSSIPAACGRWWRTTWRAARTAACCSGR